ncbi:MAG: hypothetical protein ACK50P_23585 [Planctomycetaceae bacterium]|jgi:hypothetical protein
MSSATNPPRQGACLDREEYIEQTYFFRVFRDRLLENLPAQEVLETIHEEVLTTTRLPMVIEFLRGEVGLHGRLSRGMALLTHYFTPFQVFVFQRAEEDRSKFDQLTALEILQHEASYKAQGATPAGLFVYQFESISRNRLGYDRGLAAVAADPMFAGSPWNDWILRARLQLGATDFGELIYRCSQQFVDDRRRATGESDWSPAQDVLFGQREGRIAKANRGKDPLYMFAALQRQLGYPTVPRPKKEEGLEQQVPALQAKLSHLEKRIQLLEAETRGNLDLSQFYTKPPEFPSGE